MPIQICHERERLQHEVNEILRKLTKLTTSQLEAFHSDDHDRFAELDRNWS